MRKRDRENNRSKAEEKAFRDESDRIETEWNMPACDVFRKNAEPLVETVLEMLKD